MDDDWDVENIPGELRALLKALQNSDAVRIFDEDELGVLARAANEIDALIRDNDNAHQLADIYRSAARQMGDTVIRTEDVGSTVLGIYQRRRGQRIEAAGGVH